MIKSIKILWCFLTLLILFSPQLVSAQDVVYPGDVNNNGIVNYTDALYLNSVLYQTGPPRSDMDIGIFWEPLEFSPWQSDIPGTDNLNAAFADCNGDGIVSESDMFAIYENFENTHGTLVPDIFTEGEPGTAPKLKMNFDYELEDDWLEIHVEIANLDEIQNLQACILQLDFDEEMIMGFPAELEDDNWFISNEFQLLHNESPLFEEHKEIAIIRKNNLGPASGTGTFMHLDFIIIDDVIAYSEVDFATQIVIENARFVNEQFTDIPVVYDTLDIVIPHEEIAELVAVRNRPDLQKELVIAPNPSNGIFHILTNDLQITQIELYDGIGRQIHAFRQLPAPKTLRLDAFGQGIYFLKFYTPQGIISRKVIVQ